jgi:uncharacterized membrane protein (DUF485 family)
MKTQPATTETYRADGREEAEQRDRARRNAWLLALLVLSLYVGFIVFGAIKSW